MSVTGNQGWYAEEDEDVRDEGKPMWRPVLQLNGHVMTCDGPWHLTKDECEAFIRQDVIGKGMWPDGPPT